MNLYICLTVTPLLARHIKKHVKTKKKLTPITLLLSPLKEPAHKTIFCSTFNTFVIDYL